MVGQMCLRVGHLQHQRVPVVANRHVVTAVLMIAGMVRVMILIAGMVRVMILLRVRRSSLM